MQRGQRILRRRLLRQRCGALVLSVALPAALTVACAPDPTPPTDPSSLPRDINLMTDAQAVEALGFLAADIKAGAADPEFLADVPKDQVANVDRIVKLTQSAEGRASLVAELRAAAKTEPHGLPQRPDVSSGGSLGMGSNDFAATSSTPPVTGVRSGVPSGVGTVDTSGDALGGGADFGADSQARCAAPQGVGALAAPSDVQPGQLLTPGHDVYTRASTGIALGQWAPLSIAGVDPIAGGGPGIELRPVGPFGQQMKVQINLDDPKDFGPSALVPLINIRPIGAGPGEEYRATIIDGKIYCYSGDTRSDRGYFEGWIDIPRAEPGFQVIAEVVENNHYFRCNLFDGPHCDLALSFPGPAYWAGADRSTVHAGANPVTTAAVLPASVGAFATGGQDPSGAHNVLTDTNGEMGDDLEAPIRLLLDSTIRSKVNNKLAGDLFNPLDAGLVVVQAELRKPLDTSLDLRFTTPHDGFSAPNEPVGVTGAIRAGGSAHADLLLGGSLLGIGCYNVTATADVDFTANAWADSAGANTGLDPQIAFDVNSDVNVDMDYIKYLNPVCVLIRLITLGGVVGEYFLEGGVSEGLESAFQPHISDSCLNDPTLFNPTGTRLNPSVELPERCVEQGSVQKLLQGFDLNAYLPTVGLGSASLKPLVTNIDNSWCHGTYVAPPAGCSFDQDLIGKDGIGVVGDASMVSSLAQALGGPLGGRFPNVFSPSTTSTVADLVTSHRDTAQQLAGLGVVIDPRLVNLALRDLTQGSSTSRSTNGLLDVTNVELPLAGWAVSTRPEVAPMVLGVPTPDPVVCETNCGPPAFPSPPSRSTAAIALPDVRSELTVGPNSGPPIQFSIAVTVNAGAGFNPATKKLMPIIDSPKIDLQVVGGCKADYGSGYALSYTVCGRGAAGAGALNQTGNPISLTDALAYVVNEIVIPMVSNSIGGIGLPSLDGIVPGLFTSLANVHFEQRGGFLEVFADLRPTPRFAIAPSTDGGGANEVVRFFPSQVFGMDLRRPGTTFEWDVRDGVTGQPVAITAVAADPTGPGRQTLVSNLTPTVGNFGEERNVDAKLTIRQPGLEVSSSIRFSWRPPTPPPTNPCGSIPGAGLKAATPSLVGC